MGKGATGSEGPIVFGPESKAISTTSLEEALQVLTGSPLTLDGAGSISLHVGTNESTLFKALQRLNGAEFKFDEKKLKECTTKEKRPLLGSKAFDVTDRSLRRVGSVGVRTVNTLRLLAADSVENARSGHPGMPIGMSPSAFVLFDRHLRFNPKNPAWVNRDRFVLSAGHGSILLYSLLFLYGYDSVALKDLKDFRQYGSRTPGHPENNVTPGVEVMTGALGQGLANAVGMALAEKMLAARYNEPDNAPRIRHHTYCIVGDGCLMEGITGEACSLAGHWRLGKLIVLYDDNHISIDGSTDLAFTEDVGIRFRSYGWQVIDVTNGDTDLFAIDEAITAAKAETMRPTLIKIRTTIGYGAPSKAGSSAAHGACLGKKEVLGMRERMEWPYGPFEIPHDVLKYTRRKIETGASLEKDWRESTLGESAAASDFEKYVLRKDLDFEWEEALRSCLEKLEGSGKATRHLSQACLNSLAGNIKGLVGGSADLESSCMTKLKNEGEFQATNAGGRNIYYGVREHAMGAISNGLALYGGGLIPFCATFLVFSDYMRNAIRSAALSHAGVLFIMTHDSVLLGEDGPTHQPVEHLSSFRAMPNIDVFRPGSAMETAACYAKAIENRNRPSLLVFCRQKVSDGWKQDYAGAKKGGYIAAEFGEREESSPTLPQLILLATGSEVGLAVTAARELGSTRQMLVRVVSLPSIEVFSRQPAAYQTAVLPPGVPRSRRLVVEAGSSFGWHRFANNFHTVDDFGISAPLADVERHCKLTALDVQRHAEEVLDKCSA